ncbi:MAG: hypothetical protein ABI906_10705 [Pseudomonadota bacterium]
MDDPPKPPDPARPAPAPMGGAAREARLAAALRANLKRRKVAPKADG